MRPLRVFITVAEVSGDQHAAAMVRELKRLRPDAVVEGIGGPLMGAAGCVVHHETVSGAAMGLAGATRYFEIKRIFNQIRKRFGQDRPDVWIGVDSPSMNLPFAKMAKGEFGIPTLQYVAPQLWAWREGRIRKVRQWVDALACILPFEEAYFRQRGANATFVGHPLFDEVHASPRATSDGRFPEAPPVVGLLPGSRKGEAEGCFPAILQAAGAVLAAHPGARFVVPTTAATDPVVRRMLEGFACRNAVHVEQDAFDRLVSGCDLCVVVSGTATLHVACHGVPMVTLYRGSWLAWQGMARWLVTTDTFALVNLLMPDREHVVTEIIPWFGDPRPVVSETLAMLADPERMSWQARRLREMVQTLDNPGASRRVAEMAISLAAGRV